MATAVVGCIGVWSIMFEGTSIMQIQPKGDLFPEATFTGCQHVTMATILTVYEVVQSLMLIHTTIVK